MGRPRFTAGEVTRAPWLNLRGELVHEYDESGNHRLTLNGASGDWASFGEIAFIGTKDGKYAQFGNDRLFGATTDYYLGVLDEIFEIQSIVPRKLSDFVKEAGSWKKMISI